MGIIPLSLFCKFKNPVCLPTNAFFCCCLVLVFVVLSPLMSHAADDLEKDLQIGLEQSRKVILAIQQNTLSGISLASGIRELKAIADNIRITDLLLEERFKLREEGQGTRIKALERHRAMAKGYWKAGTS